MANPTMTKQDLEYEVEEAEESEEEVEMTPSDETGRCDKCGCTKVKCTCGKV